MISFDGYFSTFFSPNERLGNRIKEEREIEKVNLLTWACGCKAGSTAEECRNWEEEDGNRAKKMAFVEKP